MPVAFKFVVVVAVRRCEQVERRFVVRLRFHFGGQRLVYLEAVAAIQMDTFGKPPGVLGIAPQQNPRSAAIPEPPMDAVLFGVAQQVGVAVPDGAFVGIHQRRVVGHPHLLHPVLGRNAKVDSCVQGTLNHFFG